MATMRRVFALFALVLAAGPSRADDVNDWLAGHPSIAQHVLWQTVPSSPDALNTAENDPSKLPWANWTTLQKQDLQAAYQRISAWHADGRPPVSEAPPPNLHAQAYPNNLSASDTGLSPEDAWRTYTELVAQSLFVEIHHIVPWSLLDLDAASLRLLFDSRRTFQRTHYYDGTPNYDGQVIPVYELGHSPLSIYHRNLNAELLPASPYVAYGFLYRNGLLATQDMPAISAQRRTVENVVDWTKRLSHAIGSGTLTENFYHWQYYGYAPPARVIDGTYYDDPSDAFPPWFGHWTFGCQGTDAFYQNILRSVNIPVQLTKICGHNIPVFRSVGLFMSHGDDPYNQDFTASGLPVSTLLRPTSEFVTFFEADFEAEVIPGHPDHIYQGGKCSNIGFYSSEAYLSALVDEADALIRSFSIQPASLTAGQPLRVTAQIRNAGPNAAHDVEAAFSFPFSASLIPPQSGYPCVDTDGSVHCTVGTLAPSGEATIDFWVDTSNLVTSGTVRASVATSSVEFYSMKFNNQAAQTLRDLAPINQPPSFTGQTFILRASQNGQVVSLGPLAYSDDGLPNPPGALTFSIPLNTTPFSVSNTGLITGVPDFVAHPDGYQFGVQASDGALSSQRLVRVLRNAAPILADRTFVVPYSQSGTRVSLGPLTARDDGFPYPAGVPQAFSLVTHDTPFAVSPAGLITGIPDALAVPQGYQFIVEVTDGDLTDQATINIRVNTPPSMSDTTLVVPHERVGGYIQFQLQATDDGLPNPPSTLSFGTTSDTGPFTLGSSGLISGQADFTEAPDGFELLLTVSDADATDQAVVRIVPGQNLPPPVFDDGFE